MSVDKKEIYTYEAPWLIYGMNWSTRPSPKFRLAVGSFIEDYKNQVELIQLDEDSRHVRRLWAPSCTRTPPPRSCSCPTSRAAGRTCWRRRATTCDIWKVNGRDDIKLSLSAQ